MGLWKPRSDFRCEGQYSAIRGWIQSSYPKLAEGKVSFLAGQIAAELQRYYKIHRVLLSKDNRWANDWPYYHRFQTECVIPRLGGLLGRKVYRVFVLFHADYERIYNV